MGRERGGSWNRRKEVASRPKATKWAQGPKSGCVRCDGSRQTVSRVFAEETAKGKEKTTDECAQQKDGFLLFFLLSILILRF